ncbi:MAG: hypothetical protein P4N59_03325 [Negativicutes bacterium]|nr:hypothetical protein [Negativicutes bacterium]
MKRTFGKILAIAAVVAVIAAGVNLYTNKGGEIKGSVGEKPAIVQQQDMTKKPNPVPPQTPQVSPQPVKTFAVSSTPAPDVAKPAPALGAQTIIPVYKIDGSGIYALPINTSVIFVRLDGVKTLDWAMTENGNLDVFYSQPNSKVEVAK